MAVYSAINETDIKQWWTNSLNNINISKPTNHVIFIHDGPVLEAIHEKQFTILIPSFIYTMLLMFLGLPGNFIVIVIYLLKMAKTTSRHFIISLAVCDFVNCAFGMPVELSLLANYYKFDYPILCKVSRFSTFFMNNTSSLVLMGIAVDRFRRVCIPLRPNMTVTQSRIICIVAGIFSMLSAAPALIIYGTRTIYIPGPANNTMVVFKTCHINDASKETTYPMIFNLYLFIGTLTIFFTLAILYACVGRVVCRRKTFSEESVRFTSSYRHDADNTVRNGRSLSVTSRFWRSVSNVSPKLLRHAQTKFGQQNKNLPDIIEPNALRDRAASETSVRRHGGKSVRAGRTTMILFLVTLLFILTFVPYLTIVTMRYIKPHMVEHMTTIERSVFNFMLRSYLMNSAFNPLIYCFLNRQFRMKVKRCFLTLFKCRNA